MAPVMSESMVITVFGLGEAGSLLAADLASAGAEVQGYDPAG
jgi:UDP-N-acetyl-D-mannosaminuronate dehydrogenase